MIEARLRRAGEQKWTWRQKFSFLVQPQGFHEPEVNVPEIIQTTVQNSNAPEKTHISADDTPQPDESWRKGREVEALAIWMWEACSPEERKLLRTFVRKTMVTVSEAFMGYVRGPDGKIVQQEDDDPDNAYHKDVIGGRFASKLDEMEQEFGCT
jgi:hypothetical protein